MLATEFLTDLVHRIEGGNLTYALVGSIAAMSYGEPRATLDVTDKHLRDITSMLRISPREIDVDRLRAMAMEHGVGKLLDRVVKTVAAA